MTHDIKLAIFDLDGVLVDTAKYHYLAWKHLADKLGFVFTKEHNERLKGVSRWRSLEILLEIGGLSDKFSKDEQNALAEEKNALYVSYINQLTQDDLLPGSRQLLEHLRQVGVKVGLGSASKNAPIILEKLGITPLFDVIIDGNATKKAKPDPEVFLLAAQSLNIEPKYCIVFEDALSGIEAALKAGMKAIGVGSPENLPGADRWIKDLSVMKAEWK